MLKDVELPPQLLRGRVTLIRSVNCIEVRLSLAFGVQFAKRIVLEGIDRNFVPDRSKRDAKKALVLLLGGKDVIVHADTTSQDGFTIGRVFFDEKIYGDPPPEAWVQPYNIDAHMLEVSLFYQWLRERDFDRAAVKAVLNGTGK
jgi:hypothetical protein